MIALHPALSTLLLLVPLSDYLFSHANVKDGVILGTNSVLPPLIGAAKALAEVGKNAHFWLRYNSLAVMTLHSLEEQQYLLATLPRFQQTIAKLTA